MPQTYIIAFAGKPKPAFLGMLKKLTEDGTVNILAATGVPGPGCTNLAIKLAEPNETFINALTLALMPARWALNDGDELVDGQFLDLVNNQGETQ